MTNVVVVRGRLSRPVGEKLLASGDRLASIDVTVPGVTRRDGTPGRAESVPASWIGAPAWLVDLEPGAEVVLMGRIRRRFFQAGGLQSRTELVVESGSPARRASKVADLVRRACADLEAGLTGDGPVPIPPVRRRVPAAPTFP